MSANVPIQLPPNTPNGPRHPDPADLTLFAMHLLSEDESATVARHLDTCAPCKEELARIIGDLTITALTAEPATPPASARERLLAQVAREKKIIPLPQAQTPAPAQAQPKVQPKPATAAPIQPPTQPAIAAFGRTSGSVLSIEDHQPKVSVMRSPLAWSGWAVAAALAVAAIFLYSDRHTLRDTLATQAGQIQRLNASAATSHQLMDALTDPHAVRITLQAKPKPKTGPLGGVTYSPEKGTLVFLASEMDPLQAYKTYELWVIPKDGSAPIPAGTFHPDENGNASVIMPDLPKGVAAKAFGVTIEDNGGSQTPTLPIIMAGS